VSFKNMIIRFSSRIKQSFSFRKRVSDLEDMVVLQKHMILDLEEENTKLRDTVIESVDLVSTYKVGMEQMKHYLQSIMAVNNDSNDNHEDSEEEDDLDIYKALRKKTTIH